MLFSDKQGRMLRATWHLDQRLVGRDLVVRDCVPLNVHRTTSGDAVALARSRAAGGAHSGEEVLVGGHGDAGSASPSLVAESGPKRRGVPAACEMSITGSLRRL